MGDAFPTTHWTAVLAAAKGKDTRARDAFAELCEAYWTPLYGFVRRQGADAEQAKDLTQSFFAVVLEGRSLHAVQPERGRFRSYLLAALKHFLSHQRERDRARKRGGGARLLSLDDDQVERQALADLREPLDPERAYERRWALTVLERAMARLDAEAAAVGTKDRLDRLKGFLVDGEDVAYAEVAGDLGLSIGAVKTSVYRLRRRFGQLLRAQVAQTVVGEGEVDAELRHLLGIVSR